MIVVDTGFVFCDILYACSKGTELSRSTSDECGWYHRGVFTKSCIKDGLVGLLAGIELT